jgi:hypothetical protein
VRPYKVQKPRNLKVAATNNKKNGLFVGLMKFGSFRGLNTPNAKGCQQKIFSIEEIRGTETSGFS